jgi:aminoglycoside phosphotransferase (APT) family kinase protein
MKDLRIHSLPETSCLEALRGACKDVLAADLQTPLARHYAQLVDMVLSRWIAATARLPSIESQHATERAAQLQHATRLLEQGAPMDPPSSAATLPAAVRGLFDLLSTAGESRASSIRAVLESIVTTDAEVRRQFESSVADVAETFGESGEAAHHTVDPSRLQAYLRTRFPEAPDITVRVVEAIPGGHSKETILFEIEPHAEWPSGMVIRMDAGRYGTSVTQEFPLLVALDRAQIPVPTPLWLEPDASVFGGAFMVTRRMPGKPPGTLWDVSGASPSSGLELAAALGRLHAQPLTAFGIDGPSTSQPLVLEMLATNEARWRERMPIASIAMEAAFGWMRDRARDLDVTASLVHGDPGLQNMLVHDGALQCILDWEFAHAGDAAEDLAYCRPAIEKIMPWHDFIAAYRAAGGAEVSVERLQFFEVWRGLRNAALAANVLYDVQHGSLAGLEMAAIAVNTYPRLEAQLAASLANVIGA